jgi:hypothetical protein
MIAPKLRAIKTTSRSLEMKADQYLISAEVIQFCRDVQLYNLYEAILMTDNEDFALTFCVVA